MVDETTSLPVESPLRITVRPSRLQDELDFADRLAGLPVEQPQLVSVPPTYGVPYSGTLPVKVNKGLKETWPARMVQSGVSLPKDVYEGKIDPISEEGIQRTQDLAGMGVVGPLAMKPGTATLGSGMTRMGEVTPKSEIAPAFYSAVEQTVKNAKMTKGTADQWIGYLRNQAGVKPEELQWTGLADLPAGKLISKTELEQHIAENKVSLKEVAKGGNYNIDAIRKLESERDQLRIDLDAARKNNKNLTGDERTKNIARMKELADRDEAIANEINSSSNTPVATKYSKYQLPGGSSYKETLLTLPSPKPKTEGWTAEQSGPGWTVFDETGAQRGSTYNAKNAQEAINEMAADRAGSLYKSSHWDEPNVLAHIRHNDRDIPTTDGKTLKSLHIEEIQSDFGQAHRKESLKIKEAINKDFDSIADRMVKAGIIKKICD